MFWSSILFICHSVLLMNLYDPSIVFHSSDASSHFNFALATYSTMPVTLVLCLVLWILSFSLTFSIFLSIVLWSISSFFTDAFTRDHTWHLYVIVGKTHWLKSILFRFMGRCLPRKISLHFTKTHSIIFLFLSISKSKVRQNTVTACIIMRQRQRERGG